MDPKIRQRLNQINREFYEITAVEFDQTRGMAWPGWERIPPHLPKAAPLDVLDVGCGNGRFGLFLAEHFDQAIRYTGVDNNPALLGYARQALSNASALSATLLQTDVIQNPLPSQQYDLIGVFGVIHHVPGNAARRDFVLHLAERLKPGGLLALACWRFYEYERFRKRLVAWPDDLADQVEQHDYLLDWRRGDYALRYCHYVDDAEHADLVAASGLEEIETYRADGFDSKVNRYSLLKKPTV